MNKLLSFVLAASTFSLTACAQKETTISEASSDVLVAYFSATGTTAQTAEALSEVTGGDLFEIAPAQAYTSEDLNWRNQHSRSSVEMADPASRPALKATHSDMDAYSVVYIGYPIWWDEAPRAVNTFIESHDLKGKKIVLFATSGGSSIDNSALVLQQAYPDLEWAGSRLLNRSSKDEISTWVKSIK